MGNKRLLRFTTLLVIIWLCTACGNSTRATTMQLVKSEGIVGVLDDKGKDIEPSENLNLYSGYNVATQNESYAWINLDNTKLTKMDVDSEIEIRKIENQLEIFVNSGSLYFNITEPLSEDETLNIRTSTMAVGIRGTCGWVEVTDESHMYVYLLEGTVECSVMNEQGNIKTFTVSGGEMAGTADGEFLVSPFKEPSIPTFVLEELLKDEEQCQKIYEDSQLDILGDWTNTDQDSSSGEEMTSEANDSSADDSSAEEVHSALDGIWVPDREEWSGDYNDTVASITLVEITKDTSSAGDRPMTMEEYSSLPDVVTPFDVGIWAYKEAVKELDSKYGGITNYNIDGYEWRILTWGGPEDRDDAEILKGHAVMESSYWRSTVQDSKDWERTDQSYFYEIIENAEFSSLEYGYEYNFTVTLDGVEYTDCKLINVTALKMLWEHYYSIVLVRVPEGYKGAISFTISGNKEENGETVINTEEYVSLLF